MNHYEKLMFFFIILHSLSEQNVHLFLDFIRPENNPLEVYSVSCLPLCLSDNLPIINHNIFFKCKKCLFNISKNNDNVVAKKSWCSSNFSNNSYVQNTLYNQLKRKFKISFSTGEKFLYAPIGPNAQLLYTHYNFTFNKVDDTYQLINVTTSIPHNISDQFITFTYEANFEENENILNQSYKNLFSFKNNNQNNEPSLFGYFVFCAILLIFLSVFVFNSTWFCSKPKSIGIITVPSYNFLITIFSGSGSGCFGYIISGIAMILTKFTSNSSWWMCLIIPACISAIFTGATTSTICALCRLKDVASSFYFAPLIFPAILLAIIFSSIWIPVCLGSCFIIPMNLIFIYIITVVFIKLPINLISGLLMGSIIRPPAYCYIRIINSRKFTTSRCFFLSFANCLLFIIIFPLAERLIERTQTGLDNYDYLTILLFIPLWIFASIIIGIASLSLGDSADWALFAFISAAGVGVALWVISFIGAIWFYKMSGTLQISLHMAISTLVCIGLSLSAGSISVLSSLLWVMLKGSPSKRS